MKRHLWIGATDSTPYIAVPIGLDRSRADRCDRKGRCFDGLHMLLNSTRRLLVHLTWMT